MSLKLADPPPSRRRLDRRLNLRITAELAERLERDGATGESRSYLVRWLLQAGLDRVEEGGLGGIAEAYWCRRGREIDGAAAGLFQAIDATRPGMVGPAIWPVKR